MLRSRKISWGLLVYFPKIMQDASSMAWIYLLLASCFEVGFTTFMKLGEGNWKSPWQIGFIFSALSSFLCLTQAARTIPLGIAYAVWTGLGASGTLIFGYLFFGDRLNWIQVALLSNLIFSVVGLKLASYS